MQWAKWEAQSTTRYLPSWVMIGWFSGRNPVAQEACVMEGLGYHQVMTGVGIGLGGQGTKQMKKAQGPSRWDTGP